jgi:hypothetical protein
MAGTREALGQRVLLSVRVWLPPALSAKRCGTQSQDILRGLARPLLNDLPWARSVVARVRPLKGACRQCGPGGRLPLGRGGVGPSHKPGNWLSHKSAWTSNSRARETAAPGFAWRRHAGSAAKPAVGRMPKLFGRVLPHTFVGWVDMIPQKVHQTVQQVTAMLETICRNARTRIRTLLPTIGWRSSQPRGCPTGSDMRQPHGL